MSKIDRLGDKANTNGFSENPQNINKGGRPKKSFSQFNEKLKAEGVEPLTKGQLLDAYSLIFNSDEESLKEIAKDKEQPLALRLIIKEMGEKSTRHYALRDFRDYMFGKAKESVQITAQVKPIKTRRIDDD